MKGLRRVWEGSEKDDVVVVVVVVVIVAVVVWCECYKTKLASDSALTPGGLQARLTWVCPLTSQQSAESSDILSPPAPPLGGEDPASSQDGTEDFWLNSTTCRFWRIKVS